MLTQVRTFTTQLLGPVTATVGIRSGVEEPPYVAEQLAGGVQIRRYGRRIAAQTAVDGDEEAARSAGFRRLAGYIFGANHRGDRIAMTAPVGQQQHTEAGRKIAMTAPVGQQGSQERGWIIRFYMPAGSTLETLPIPDDEHVELVEVPAETVAVLRFSGDRGADSIARHTDQLRDTLRDYGFATAGDPSAWFYDPPWTLPCRRRNEIAIPIET
ncbi:SOUL family heme-binding protein [Mycolicibacterium mucogenicum]|uniref:Heme-binding protein n=1 Tax=Mycolicibacterium mucogenicum TaxID=56689 RepID=A0A4R5W9Z2_MYCMU|nr:heme-binding protein [Mycolicibacterium mucogenicum]TDK84817.1 heme-binding protein [Mycolicibacterium mucogenicum]